MIWPDAPLFALAASAFTSATLLPGTSEVLLLALHHAGAAAPTTLVAVASLANVAGSAVNWALGRFAISFAGRRWFPASRAQVARAQGWYGRYGLWSLLASWVPIVGDPLTVVAGAMRVPFPTFLIIVALAKTGRYAALVWIAGRLT